MRSPWIWVMLFLVLCDTLVVGAQLQRTVTKSLLPPAGSLKMHRSRLPRILFTKPLIHPPPALEFHVFNNSLALDADAACREILQSGSVRGVDEGSVWPSSLLDVSRASVAVHGDYEVLLLPIAADASFKGGVFEFALPAACSAVRSSPEPVTFQVVPGTRQALGRVLTFVTLMGASVSVINSFGGSLTALMPAQQQALLTMNNCNAEPLQQEGEVLQYVVGPVQVTLGGLSPAMSVVVVQLAIVVGGWIADGARGLAMLMCRSTASRDASNKRAPQNATSSDEDNGTAGGGRPVRRAAKWMMLDAPYLAMVVQLALGSGLVFWSVPALSTNSRLLQMLCAFSLMTAMLLSPVASLVLARRSGLKFCPYQSSKGKIPRWLQPEGIWGPNESRMRWGVIVEDFKKNSKLFGGVFLLLRGLFAVIFATTPGTTAGCRMVLYMALVIMAATAALVWCLEPLRSPFLNGGFVASQVLLLAYAAFSLVWNGFVQSGDDHWSVVGALVIGLASGLWQTLLALGHLFIIVWEAGDGRGIRHVQSLVPRAQRVSVEDQVNAMVHEMEQLFAEGGSGGGGIPDLRHADLVDREELASKPSGGPTASASARGKKGPMTLADYLLEDYEKVPVETREEFSLAAHFHRRQGMRHQHSATLLEPMVLHPSLRPVPRNNPHFMPPRGEVPPNLQTLQPHVS